MGKEKLLTLWRSYISAYDDLEARKEATDLKEYHAHVHLKLGMSDITERMRKIFSELIAQVPEEDRKRVDELCNPISAEERDGTYRRFNIERLMSEVDDKMSPEEYDKMAEDAEKYIPRRLDFTPVRKFSSIIEKRKAEIAASELSNAEKEDFIKLLDRADSIFIGDEESRVQSRIEPSEALGSANLDRMADLAEESLDDPENAKYRGVFSRQRRGRLSVSYKTDPETLARLRADKIELSPELKNSIRMVWRKLDEVGYGATGHFEQPHEQSASRFLGYYTDDFEAAYDIIVSGSFDEIAAATALQERNFEKLSQIYAAGREAFPGDDNSGFIANNCSMRVSYLSPEFKTSLRVDTNISVVSMMQDFIRRNEMDFEGFLEDPIGSMREAAERFNRIMNVDSRVEGMSLGQALAHLNTKLTEYDGVYILNSTAERLMSSLLQMEPNAELQRKNSVPAMFAAYDVGQQFLKPQALMAFRDYFPRCVAGIFLVEDQDRRFEDFAHDGALLDFNSMETRAPLDQDEYIRTHSIHPVRFRDRVLGGITEFIAEGGDLHDCHYLIESARDSVLLLLTSRSVKEGSAIYKELESFYNDPMASLKKEAQMRRMNMPNIAVQLRPKLAQQEKSIANREKTEKKAIDNFMKEEKAANKSLAKLTLELERAMERLQRSPDDKKAIEAHELAATALADAKNQQLTKLSSALSEGKITSVYLEARTNDIVIGKFDTERSMFVPGLSDKKTFMAERLAAGMSKENAETSFAALSQKEAVELRQATKERMKGKTPRIYTKKEVKVTASAEKASPNRRKISVLTTAKTAKSFEKTKPVNAKEKEKEIDRTI